MRQETLRWPLNSAKQSCVCPALTKLDTAEILRKAKQKAAAFSLLTLLFCCESGCEHPTLQGVKCTRRCNDRINCKLRKRKGNDSIAKWKEGEGRRGGAGTDGRRGKAWSI